MYPSFTVIQGSKTVVSNNTMGIRGTVLTFGVYVENHWLRMIKKHKKIYSNKTDKMGYNYISNHTVSTWMFDLRLM